jgi:hypothetical protein
MGGGLTRVNQHQEDLKARCPKRTVAMISDLAIAVVLVLITWKAL